jgi:lipid-A-disaccharide synthase
MGPLEALRRIPPLLLIALRHALWLRANPPALVVLVDFGAFNLRLARMLKALRYPRPVLYYFPPGAWLDNPKQAVSVASNSIPLTAFAHQRDFYASLGLEIAYFGHPLASLVAPREPRPAPPPDAGTIALLPGSRRGEIARHMPRLLEAYGILRARRPHVRALVSAANAEAERWIRAHSGSLEIVRGAKTALDAADAACIASGTAVLEAALREVPSVALYVVAPAQVAIAKRIWRGSAITLPNLLTGRTVVPELQQDAATPNAIAEALEALLRDPAAQVAGLRDVRRTLGASDALRRCAAFATALGRSA